MTSQIPYTHAAHAAACREAAEAGRVLVQLVQVRRAGVVYCARLREPWTVPGGPDCWTVEALFPECGRLTVPCKNVRACDDQSCACTAAGSAGRPASAARPDGAEAGSHA
jgi:hypothetical protein